MRAPMGGGVPIPHTSIFFPSIPHTSIFFSSIPHTSIFFLQKIRLVMKYIALHVKTVKIDSNWMLCSACREYCILLSLLFRAQRGKIRASRIMRFEKMINTSYLLMIKHLIPLSLFAKYLIPVSLLAQYLIPLSFC